MKGLTAVISGASRGLGFSLASCLHGQGVTIFALASKASSWKSLPVALKSDSRFICLSGDLTSPSTISRLCRSIKKGTQTLDLLIHSAGYGGKLQNIADVPLTEWQRHLAINLTAPFLMTQELLPLLRKSNDGKIINVSSMAGTRGVPKLGPYSVSKFGIRGLTQSLAKEEIDSGLKAWTVCPGGMNTRMRSDLFGKKDARMQQSADFVSQIIMDLIVGRLPVESGSDIVIRHGKVTCIATPPTS